MSKLADQVQATITNVKGAIYPSFNINMSLEVEPNIDIYQSTIVRFTATFGTQYFIDDSAIQSPDAMECVLRSVREDVIQTVFGEFREPLMELKHLLYDRKWDKALSKLEDIRKEMFRV